MITLRPEIIAYFDNKPDYRHFIRLNPEWYTRLSRDPSQIHFMKEKVDDFYGRSLTKKVEKFGQQLDMINMLIDLAMVAGDSPIKTGEAK